MTAVSTLNAAFSAFDDEVQGPMVYKVETVGHVYMAVSGGSLFALLKRTSTGRVPL